MSGPRISDHALVRFLERAGNLPVEALREQLAASLARAHAAALSIGAVNYVIKADGMIFPVRDGTITTVLDDRDAYAAAAAVDYPRREAPLR